MVSERVRQVSSVPCALENDVSRTFRSSILQLEDLYRLDAAFLERLEAPLRTQLLAYREGNHGLSALQVSEMLLACAPVLEGQVAALFGVEEEVRRLRESARSHDVVFEFKKQFVQKRARKRMHAQEDLGTFASLDAWLNGMLQDFGMQGTDRELSVAKLAIWLLEDEKANSEAIERMTRWCAQAMTTAE